MTSSKPQIAISAIAPIVLLAILIVFLLGPASTFLQFGIVLPEISIEKVEFIGNEIQATVRNTGPIDVNVVVADVNDRIQPAAIEPDTHLERFETALVRIPFDWNEQNISHTSVVHTEIMFPKNFVSFTLKINL